MSKNKSDQLQSSSYMQMRIDFDGKKGAVFLRIPTFWDAVKNQWIGALKLSDGKLIHAMGKDSFDLQNNFNIEISKAMHSEYSDEIFNMFKPMEYWERKSSE